MVMGSMRDCPGQRRSWATIARRTVVFSAVWGGLIGWLCDSLLAGLISAGAVLALPVLCLAVSVFLGLVVIPPTMLVLRALGVRFRRAGEDGGGEDTVNRPRPGTLGGTSGDT